LDKFTRLGRIGRKNERTTVEGWLDDYDVKPRATERAIGNLSGGNQQKSVVGKWLEKAPRILVLDEPTQGVDVGARADIYRLVEGAAAGGAAVLLIDTDIDELVNRADRVFVLVDGAVVGELSGSALTRERVLELTQGLEHVSE
jgi:ribose transport system ATP-binding protein